MQLLLLVCVCLISCCEGFVVPRPVRLPPDFRDLAGSGFGLPTFRDGLSFNDIDDDYGVVLPGTASVSGFDTLTEGGLFGQQPQFDHRSREPFREADYGPCPETEVRNLDGLCERPIVTRNVFLYAVPQLPVERPPPPPIPKPRVNYNVVFIRNPDQPKDPNPIVIPPPHQKTLVYILNKLNDLEQEVIELPPGPIQRPEVFYVNYNEGDNPQLPFGIDLQTALNSIRSQGEISGALVNDDPANIAAQLKAEAKLNAAGAFRGGGGGGEGSISTVASRIYGPPKA